jgi:L-alanine-DL-glutamate epimerase-like enolase superfamily enzyme
MRTDCKITSFALELIPITTRVPLKFGAETLTAVTLLRARATIEDRQGHTATGVGETPLSVQWGWPSPLPYQPRLDAMVAAAHRLAAAWAATGAFGHPVELGEDFRRDQLFHLLAPHQSHPQVPYLAGLITLSALDIAVHDAFGMLHQVDVYSTYSGNWMTRDLASFLTPSPGASCSFHGLFPADFLEPAPPSCLPVWHLVGGLDPLTAADLTGEEPADGHPILLADWIRKDGLTCLKVKLRGTDPAWDFDRLVQIGDLSAPLGVRWLSADFNCTVTAPAYVSDILARLLRDSPSTFQRLLYVEQPFPYELSEHPLDVRAAAAWKPLFLDESAHDWREIARGRDLGWSGVALKTCKTQTGALLSLCWAKAHGMPLMVQDLTNPRLAAIPHVRLAAHAGTIMGVESNAMQFYPDASREEQAVHPGIYRRRGGQLDLSTLSGPGFSYARSRPS